MKKIFIYFIAGSLLMSGCGKKEASDSEESQQSKSTAKHTDPVQHKVMSFSLEGMTEKGAKNWSVKGDSAESVSETQMKLNNIQANSYGADSKAVITADNGMYDKGRNNVTLEKNVKAIIENTESGARDFLALPDAKEGASRPKPAANAPAKKTKTTITCDGDVLFDYQNNHVYFNKNVKVNSVEGSIDADKITVNMDPKTRKINEIIAEGNVKMVRGENVTYSDKATYVEADKKVSLVGQPKLVVYQDGGIAGNFLGASDASTGDARSK